MNSTAKSVWEKLEKNVGKCCLYKVGAVNELSGKNNFTLTLATMARPAEIENYVANSQGFNKTDNRYRFNKLPNLQSSAASITVRSSFDDLFFSRNAFITHTDKAANTGEYYKSKNKN